MGPADAFCLSFLLLPNLLAKTRRLVAVETELIWCFLPHMLSIKHSSIVVVERNEVRADVGDDAGDPISDTKQFRGVAKLEAVAKTSRDDTLQFAV